MFTEHAGRDKLPLQKLYCIISLNCSQGCAIVWDTKRQIIWLAAGLTFGSFVLYQEAHDEAGRFDPSYFAQLEMLLLIIIAIMFHIYSRKK